MPAPRADSGILPTPIVMSVRRTPATTSTCSTASTSMPASSSPTSVCSRSTSSITGPISRRTSRRTHHGSSTACACSGIPTAKLKIEPWFINGWQSYGRFNNRPGLGGQILWRPNGKLEILGNQYGYGEDALGIPSRTRLHTDDSIQYKYYQSTTSFISMAAATLTGDAGCESGGGVSCFGNGKTRPEAELPRLHGLQPACGLIATVCPDLAADGSTTPAAIWCCCRRSMERLRPREHRTSPRTPEIRSRPGTLRSQQTTCRASTSPIGWSTTTARQTFRTSAGLEALRRREEIPEL